jgi:hypothetical protein
MGMGVSDQEARLVRNNLVAKCPDTSPESRLNSFKSSDPHLLILILGSEANAET